MHMKEEYTYDYVHGTDVWLYQHKSMFRMNTDTSLLAHFMRIKEGERVLDIGTNNGALLAVANRQKPIFLYGVEIQEKAAELARYNMKHLQIEHAEILCGDVREIKLPKVDVVLCNPPYFKTRENSHTNASLSLTIARHEQYLTLPQLAAKASEALDEKGRLYLVHRPDRLADIITTLRQFRLEVRTLQFVYDEAKKEARSVLIEALKDGRAHMHVLPPQLLQR